MRRLFNTLSIFRISRFQKPHIVSRIINLPIDVIAMTDLLLALVALFFSDDEPYTPSDSPPSRWQLVFALIGSLCFVAASIAVAILKEPLLGAVGILFFGLSAGFCMREIFRT
jgi:hypothetical protein